jgi:putative DNA primase/helicase
METFIESRGDRHPTELAYLRGARLVTAQETERGRRWAETKIKALTGGDPISARFMRQDFFTFMPQFKLFIAGNYKPGLRGVNEAIRRRFNLIPFLVTIPEQDRDPQLDEKLKAEWPGILQWMIDGCLAWQKGGLRPPPAVVDATTAYLAEQDTLELWLEEKCAVDAIYTATVADLFDSWKEWTAANGEYTGSKKRFSQALEDRGFERMRISTERWFKGLALRP